MNVAIIAGGRDFIQRVHLMTACDFYTRSWEGRPWTIIIGVSLEEYEAHCREAAFDVSRLYGADTLAYYWALARNHRIEGFPADWVKYGRPAGPIRNRQMAQRAAELLPSAKLIAFWDRRSAGTASMISEAKRAGLKVHIEYYNQ